MSRLTPALPLLLLLGPACDLYAGDGDGDDNGACTAGERTEIDPAGSRYQFVIDSVDLPESASESHDYGMNLDGDPQGRPDNAMGQVLSTIFAQLGTEADGKVADEIAAGNILHLVELSTTSLDDANGVAARLFLGVDRDGDPADNFSGDEPFDIESGHPVRPMTGYIMDGRISVELGVLPLKISFPELDEPFVLELTAARLEATATAGGLAGRIGGGITEAELTDTLLPIVHQSLANSVATDCDADGCVPGSNGQYFLELFDEDGDGAISFAEVTENSIVSSLLAPDVDLFDENGDFRPRCDGVKDSMSVGVAFTAVPAQFSAPPL